MLYLGNQCVRVFGHSTILCADIGTDLYSYAVSSLQRFAVEDGCAERARERVASTYRVSNGHLRRLLERRQTRRKDVRTIGATRQNQHLQLIFCQHLLADATHIQIVIAIHALDDNQFFIVNLQDVAALQRLLNDILGIELLAQIDIENLQAVLWRVVKELADASP